MNEAKPIFTVAIPFDQDGKPFDTNKLKEIQTQLESMLTDYHVLIFLHNKEDLRFQAFYAKDFKETDLDELKKIVSQCVK